MAGIQASLQLASPDRKIYLVEKTPLLGGLVTNFEKNFLSMKPLSNTVNEKIKEINSNENISKINLFFSTCSGMSSGRVKCVGKTKETN